ncbi:tRNA (adenosine(37)-N6)-dimethylallyltransferase MiaA [soil metagenome]
MTIACRRPKLVVIAGPTAAGKTKLAIDLAGQFNGEVVNADSRYLYRGLAIGVAKPSLAERQGVPHHLIDILDPHEEMTLALFQKRANETIGSALDRSKLPVLAGGTPLYINAVIEGWRIPEVPPDPAFRQRMEARAETEGIEALVAQLKTVDAEAATRSARNLRRVIRALEIYEATGTPMSELQGKGPRPYDTLELGLWMPREVLLTTVDQRVDDQIAAGLVDEVRGLLVNGVDPQSPALSSLGYRQLLPFFDGKVTLEAAIERIKFDTHRYVRHQETWLKRNERLLRVDVTVPGWMQRCAELVQVFIDSAA